MTSLSFSMWIKQLLDIYLTRDEQLSRILLLHAWLCGWAFVLCDCD